MGIKSYGKDINLVATAHHLQLPGGGCGWEGCPLPGWVTTSTPAAGDLRATMEANKTGCYQRQRLGLIQTGKSKVPIKELNKGPVSDKKEIKLLDCWL